MVPPAHGDRQSGAKTSERPVASKRTAIGVPKQQKQDLDFLDGKQRSCETLAEHHSPSCTFPIKTEQTLLFLPACV